METNFALPDLRDHEPIKHVKYCIATTGTRPHETSSVCIERRRRGARRVCRHRFVAQLARRLRGAFDGIGHAGGEGGRPAPWFDYVVSVQFIPQHFEKCAGQILPIKSNPGLFSLLFDRFGGDGQKDFGLPDMRGQAPIKELTYVIATNGRYPDRKRLEPHYTGAPLLGQLSLVPYRPKHTPPPGSAT